MHSALRLSSLRSVKNLSAHQQPPCRMPFSLSQNGARAHAQRFVQSQVHRRRAACCYYSTASSSSTSAASSSSSSPSAKEKSPSSSSSSSSPESPPSAATPEEGYSAEEMEIYTKLSERFKPSRLQVQDVSGGCGAFFAITIESKDFAGMSVVKQHRLVNDALKDKIAGIHGLQLKTIVDTSS